MITLKLRDGSDLNLDAKKILRIRKTIAHLDDDLGNTRVDWSRTDHVMNEASEVAISAKNDGLDHITSLTMPGGTPVWFNGEKSSGPIVVVPQNRGEGVGSSFEIGNKVQLVRETPAQVAVVIGNAGGEVMPFHEDTFLNTAVEKVRSWFGADDSESSTPSGANIELEEWDPGLTLKAPPTS